MRENRVHGHLGTSYPTIHAVGAGRVQVIRTELPFVVERPERVCGIQMDHLDSPTCPSRQETELCSEVVDRRLVEGMKKAAYPPA